MLVSSSAMAKKLLVVLTFSWFSLLMAAQENVSHIYVDALSFPIYGKAIVSILLASCKLAS